MTEKFKLVKSEPHIENIETGECYDLNSDNFSYIVKIMNDLSNENEQLRQQINELQFNKAIGQREYQKEVFASTHTGRECVNCEYGCGGGSDVYCTHKPRGKESYMCDTDCKYFKKRELNLRRS